MSPEQIAEIEARAASYRFTVERGEIPCEHREYINVLANDVLALLAENARLRDESARMHRAFASVVEQCQSHITSLQEARAENLRLATTHTLVACSFCEKRLGDE